jgi:hypothetical protein
MPTDLPTPARRDCSLLAYAGELLFADLIYRRPTLAVIDQHNDLLARIILGGHADCICIDNDSDLKAIHLRRAYSTWEPEIIQPPLEILPPLAGFVLKIVSGHAL